MCFASLAARGVKVRFTRKEDRTKPLTLERDEEEIRTKKANRHKEAQRAVNKRTRSRKKKAKMEREGFKNLRRAKLIH